VQAVYIDEDEMTTSGRTNPVGVVIYTRKSSRCVEGEYIGI